MSKIGDLRDELLKLLKEHERDGALPTSGRFLFYELVQRGIISKHPSGKRPADQDMNEALTDLREDELIPWDWIVDETRSLEDYTGSPTVKDWVLAVLWGARIDPWGGDEPLILTESRSLAGVLRETCREYALTDQGHSLTHFQLDQSLNFTLQVSYLFWTCFHFIIGLVFLLVDLC
jgi:hypothetical protein